MFTRFRGRFCLGLLLVLEYPGRFWRALIMFWRVDLWVVIDMF